MDLESLNINEFEWELIVIEEDGLYSKQVKEYCEKIKSKEQYK